MQCLYPDSNVENLLEDHMSHIDISELPSAPIKTFVESHWMVLSPVFQWAPRHLHVVGSALHRTEDQQIVGTLGRKLLKNHRDAIRRCHQPKIATIYRNQAEKRARFENEVILTKWFIVPWCQVMNLLMFLQLTIVFQGLVGHEAAKSIHNEDIDQWSCEMIICLVVQLSLH